MARINEYKTKGGSFSDAVEAISALESFLEEVKKTRDKSSTKIEKDRRYQKNVSGLKDCALNLFTIRPGKAPAE